MVKLATGAIEAGIPIKNFRIVAIGLSIGAVVAGVLIGLKVQQVLHTL